MSGGLPDGVVTFVFTDIEGSTALWDTAASAMASALAAHERLVGESVDAHGGILVKSKGEGDSTLSVFTHASAGAAAAVALQRRLTAEQWPGGLELRTRVGVHTGEAQLRDGDYYGGTLNRAARIRGLAAGGQVLCSRATADLVADALPEGVELLALGTHTLKGLRRDEAVYALTHPELPDCARPLGTDIPSDVVHAPLPVRLAGAGSAFVGREAELAVIDSALDDVRASRRRRVVLVSGEPGIGKTTLTAAHAAAAHAAGAVVVYGRCDEDLGIPYQPWAEAITHLVRHLPEAARAAHRARRGAVLARLVPELDSGFRVPNAPSSDAESDRYLLFGAVVDLLECASGSPIVVVLDDLHWADAPSLQLLRYVVGADAALPLMIVATFRGTEQRDDTLAQTLAALYREPGVDHVELTGLEDDALRALLEATAGHALGPDGLVLRDALAAETGGNPFFVTEVLRHLAETGVLRREEGRWAATERLTPLSLPTSVREVTMRRVARLGEDVGSLLSCAAVIGREFDLELLAEVADVDEAAAIDGIDVAAQAALVHPVEGRDRYAFVHALVEHALSDALSPPRRRRLHARIAGALESQLGDEPRERAAEVAGHWLEAGTDRNRAIEWASRAGAYALARLAPDDAAQWYRSALELLDEEGAGDDRRRGEALCGLGVAQRDAGDGDFRATLLEAGRLAARLDDPPLMARAALANARGGLSNVAGVDQERVAALEAAAGCIEDDASRAMLLGRLANELTLAPDVTRSSDIADDAIALARRSGDPRAFVDVVVNVYFPLRSHETGDLRRALTAEALERAEQVDDLALRYWAHHRRALALIEGCDLEAYDEQEAAVVDLAERIDRPTLRWHTELIVCTRLMLAGDLGEAERRAEANLALGLESGQPDALAMYAGQFANLRYQQGRIGELVDTLTEAPGAFRVATALARSFAGQEQQAIRDVEALAENGFTAVTSGYNRMTNLAILAETTARCRLPAVAAALLQQMRSSAGTFLHLGVASFGVVDHYLGMLATTVGAYDEALTHLDRAAELHARLDAPYFMAFTDVERATAFQARGARGDAERARDLAAAVRPIAEERGFAELARRAVELAETTD